MKQLETKLASGVPEKGKVEVTFCDHCSSCTLLALTLETQGKRRNLSDTLILFALIGLSFFYLQEDRMTESSKN